MSAPQSMMNINEYVIKFLTNMGTNEMIKAWQSNENQTKLKKALTEKKLKDPEKPKAACTAYIFFTMEERPKIVEADPTMKPTEIMKEMATRWAGLKASNDTEDKEKVAYYEAKAAEDKKRAAQELEGYVAPPQEVLKQKVQEKKASGSSGSKPRAKRDPAKPKAAVTAWLLYCQDNREAVKSEGISGRDVTRELGVRWKEFQKDPANAAKMAEYKELVAQDKTRFSAEMEGYTPPANEPEPEPVKKPATTLKKGKAKAKEPPVEDPDATDVDSDDEDDSSSSSGSSESSSSGSSGSEPEPPKKSAAKSSPSPKKADPRGYYMKVMRPLAKEKYPQAKAQEIAKYLSAWWKDVSKEDREMWRQRAESEQ